MESEFAYSLDLDSLRQGAEAKIYEGVYLGRPAILKERVSKAYRHEILDKRLNSTRFRSEIKGIARARQAGVLTPAIYFTDTERRLIIMERIEGCTTKEWIENQRNLGEEEFMATTTRFGEHLGREIAKIHLIGLMHGDLTTANIMIKNQDPTQLVFVDFGLANLGRVIAEDKGVDLYVLEKAIQVTHFDCDHIMTAILKGYESHNAKQGEAVHKKLAEIRLRGRKREMAG